jgi:hypothetical protein
MSNFKEIIGNNDLRFEDLTSNSGFHHVAITDADDGDTIILDEDDIKALINKLEQHIKKYKL